MRLSRKRFFFFVLPLSLLLLALLFPSQISQDQTLIWIRGDERGGSYSWENMPQDGGSQDHTLYLKFPVVRPVVFYLTPNSGAHGVKLLPGSPRTNWQDSGLQRNPGPADWTYPMGGWKPSSPGTYVFYCPLYPQMRVKIVANRHGKPDW